MIELSLTDFVDLVSRTSTEKASKIREIKKRGPYSPKQDFYRQVRKGIVRCHKEQLGRGGLAQAVGPINDRRKRLHFRAVMDGHKKYWGRKTLSPIPVYKTEYQKNGVSIRVNPELAWEHNGVRHIVKLYFKSTPLAKRRVDLISHLMEVSLQPLLTSGHIMAIHDTQNSKLITPTVPIAGMTAMIDAEIAYIAALWPTI